MSEIFVTVQNVADRRVGPDIRICISVISGNHSFFLLLVRGRNQNPFRSQCFPDGAERYCLGGYIKDLPDHCSRLRIDKECLLIRRIDPVSVGNCAAAPQTVLHTVPENSLNLLAGVSGVPFIHDIEKWHKLILGRIITVNIVVDLNGSHALFRKHNLAIESDLQIVSADTGHILDAYGFYVPCLDFIQKSLKARAVKIRARIAVICEMADAPETVSFRVIFQIFLLIGDRV